MTAGLLIAVGFCSAWIGYGLLKSADYERQARANTAEYASYARDKVAKSCVGIPRLEAIECLHDARDAQQEYRYNQTDLVAQRQSALWAYIMASAAVIGMGLSVIGVWLVWTTFAETRKANVISQAALVAETRPILLFQEFRLSRRTQADAWSIWRPVWADHGKDPCKIICFECSRCYADHAFLEEFIQDLKAIEKPIRSLDKTVILAAGQEFVGDELLIKDDQLLTGMRLGPEKRPMSHTGFPEKWELAIFWTKFSYISAFAPDDAQRYQIDAIQTCVMTRDRSGFVFESPPGHTSMT